MAVDFTLSLYPWTYIARFGDSIGWNGAFLEKVHKSPGEESTMSAESRSSILEGRNSFPEMPLVNYTSQYAMGCFEGLKAFPQKDGSLKLFRPDLNACRFQKSMEGLRMPSYPAKQFLAAVAELVSLNAQLGFRPLYDNSWEKDNFLRASSIYLRPFTWSESGIGLNLSANPSVVMVATPVGSYFDPDANSKAVTTNMIRATDNGIGWIKCNANYVIPILAKKQAIDDGYMEAIFLDYKENKYIEEGSSCNIFFFLKNGSLVTPSLEDRILNGVNRRSVMQLAIDEGIKVEERRISIEEALDQTEECFVTGTAAGVSYIESITHGSKTSKFGNGKMGAFTQNMLNTLKGIQYGTVKDRHDWMHEIQSR